MKAGLRNPGSDSEYRYGCWCRCVLVRCSSANCVYQ